MKKCFLFVIVFFSTAQFAPTYAQTYPIPGATQQPRWVFPFFIEDAIGQKDTVYVGYDTSVTSFICNADTVFGEFWLHPDTNFIAGAICGSGDSITKVEITSFMFPPNYFNFGALNVHFPVILRWDVSLLRSDSLPFPDQDPAPRAQVDMYWFFGTNALFDASCGEPIIISDSVNNVGFCQRRDSIIIYDLFGNPGKQDCGVVISITPWSGQPYGTSVTENSGDNSFIKISPNPAQDFFTIKCDYPIQNLEIYNAQGQSLFFQKRVNINEAINIKQFNKGVYVVKFQVENNVAFRKLLKY